MVTAASAITSRRRWVKQPALLALMHAQRQLESEASVRVEIAEV